MFYDPGTVFSAILLVAGLYWCKEVYGRWRQDVQELRSGDRTRQSVIVVIWLLTSGIIVLIVNFVWAIVANIIDAFS